MDKDYYETLGVSRDASREDIKKAYKRLAKKYHPDLNREEGSAERFKEINEAAAVLGDEKRRSQYDRFGTSAEQFNGFQGYDFGGGDFGSFNFDDIFESFFGNSPFSGFSRRTERRRPRSRGHDLRVSISITLEDAYRGATRALTIEKLESCPDCSGTGARKGSDIISCEECGGSGFVRTTARTPFGIFQTTSNCPKCRGEGKLIMNPCPKCHSNGRLNRTRRLDVKVPAGVDAGSQLRISGEGEAGEKGGPPGDLYVEINVKDHPVFEREGDDLYTEIPISFVQAALGDEIEVPTIESRAKMTIPAGTETNTIFKLRNKGMPHLQGAGSGDILIRVIVIVPKRLSKRQRELLLEYARESKDTVSPRQGFFSKLRDAMK